MEVKDKKDEICLQAALIDKKRNWQYIKRNYEIKEKEILSENVTKLQNKIKQKQEQIESAADFMEEIYIGEKPLTDLILERQMEKDIEEELERLESLEKAHQEIQKD